MMDMVIYIRETPVDEWHWMRGCAAYAKVKERPHMREHLIQWRRSKDMLLCPCCLTEENKLRRRDMLPFSASKKSTLRGETYAETNY